MLYRPGASTISVSSAKASISSYTLLTKTVFPAAEPVCGSSRTSAASRKASHRHPVLQVLSIFIPPCVWYKVPRVLPAGRPLYPAGVKKQGKGFLIAFLHLHYSGKGFPAVLRNPSVFSTMLGLKKQHTISPIFKIGILIRVEKIRIFAIRMKNGILIILHPLPLLG